MRGRGSAADRLQILRDRVEDREAELERAPDQSFDRHGTSSSCELERSRGQKFAHRSSKKRDGVTWAFQHNGSLIVNLPKWEGNTRCAQMTEYN